MARETKVDVYMPLFVADYLADTSHLSCEEDGAYLRILMHLWRRDGRMEFDHDRLAAICKLPRRRWDGVWKALGPFFEVSDGILSQGRLSHELSTAYARKAEASEAGKRGAAKRWGGHGDPNGHPMATPLRPQWRNDGSSSPSPTETETPPVGARDLGGAGLTPVRAPMQPYPIGAATIPFLGVFERYVNPNGKVAAAAVWQDIAGRHPGGEQALATEIGAAFDAGLLKQHPYAGEPRYRPAFEKFLAERRWLDKVVPAGTQAQRGSNGARGDPRHGHARAEDFKHTTTGEVKL